MKKLFFAWIMALWCFPAVFAQSGQGIRYQGEVGVGTAFGVGSNAYDRFVLETVHGVRIGPRLFVGLGVAWNYYSARGDMPDDSFRVHRRRPFVRPDFRRYEGLFPRPADFPPI